MKIVVTGTRGIPNVMGGVETHCEELFPRIAAMGVDVTVVRRSNYVSDGLTDWKGVKIVDLQSPKKKSFEAVIHTFRAVNYAVKVKADILHVHAIGPALLVPYAKMRGLKVVFTHHGPDYDRDKWGFLAKTMLKLGERFGCRFADKVIVISNVIKDLIARKYNRTSDVHLIYNGVPEPDVCSFPEYFDELGIAEGKFVLGMCRFVPEKNLHHLVEAFVKWRGNNPNSDIKLVLAGDTDFEDDYSRSLKQMAQDNGVVLTGFIKGRKLHSLLSHCACYVLPSSHEGLPIALLEAMSYGARVIVSDIPANLEVGLPKECYFQCGDVDALASRIGEVLLECGRLVRDGNDGRRAACTPKYDMTKYNWDEIAKQVLEVYMSL